MLTKEQALTAHEFHYGNCSQTIGPRGGTKTHIETWRRNGATKTWVTRPNEWRIPVKHGMFTYDHIRNDDAEQFHTRADCPLLRQLQS